MAEKMIRQQPVTLVETNQVTYILFPTGTSIDFSYSYTPVDETGMPVGEKRVLSGTKTGPAAQEIRDWITTKVLPEINMHEGTA
jgi:hypothetical protein